MDRVTVEGAIDLHIHSHPCLFRRIGDDRAIVSAACSAGMRAVVLKCHHESSVSRAYLMDQEFPQIRVFGGIVLNTYVGGINPAAVEAALRLGGKAVWMPTIDSANHARTFGSTGGYGVQSGGRQAAQGISILVDGRITEAVQEVLRLIAQYDVILGTGHLFPEEIVALVRAAKSAGVRKLVVNHPFFRVPNLDLPTLQELIALGATAEIDYCGVSPMWAWEGTNVARYCEAIATLGAQNCILISDGGQRHNPLPAECLRVLAQCLFERGVSQVQLETMMRTKPAELLSLESC